MKRVRLLALLLASLLLAPIANADEPTKPDYSREALLRIFSVNIPPPQRERAIEFGFGTIEFKALGTRWRFIYLPIFAPLSGSIRRTNAELPNPFALTGTEIAYTPRTWRHDREMSRELRRIERMERERAKVRVKTE